MTTDVLELGVLGPLDARLGGVSLPLGGAKQRAVLAALLLREGEIVSVERLIDEVWGDEPPPSAARTLESYVSRLRQVLNAYGPTLVRRGPGYALDLQGARLDVHRFLALQEDASLAAADGEYERAVALTAEALGTWRGAALADVALASAGRAEAERLEELRLRTYEVRADAELALGRHEHAVSELQALVSQNPYRERFVAQLMLALYRSGRQAEALEIYERTRTALADDLGLRPSQELQQLSGRMVRQDPELCRPTLETQGVESPRDRIPARARRVAALALAGAVTAAVMAFTATGSAPSAAATSPASASRPHVGAHVALVLPDDSRYPELVPWGPSPFPESGAKWGFETTVMDGAITQLGSRIRDGRFDLVLVIGHGPAAALSQVVRQMPETRFAFLDTTLADLSLEGVPNATAVRFAYEQESELAGYLSALVPERGRAPTDRVDKVSVVAGPDSAKARRVVAGFRKGVRHVRARTVPVRVDYVDGLDLTTCEQVANDQIDAGSDVVFVDAGRCGLGALAVARTRGVWGIGSYEDGVELGPHVLAVTYKDYGHAIDDVLVEFALGQFHAGADDVLGLNDDYAVGVEDADRNGAVPAWVWSRVVSLCSKIRSQTGAP